MRHGRRSPNGVRQTLHIEAERLSIPDGKTADEIRQIVETAAAKSRKELS